MLLTLSSLDDVFWNYSPVGELWPVICFPKGMIDLDELIGAFLFELFFLFMYYLWLFAIY